MKLLLVLWGSVLAGCAGKAAAVKVPAQEAFGSPFSSREATVGSLPRGPACERAAAVERLNSPERGLTLLRGCFAHGDVPSIGALATRWRSELKALDDAPTLLAQALASSSTLQHDLSTLQRQGVALYDVSTAMTRPEAFRGQLVAFMGEVREATGKDTLMLVELVNTTERVEVPTGKTVEVETTVSGQQLGRTAERRSEVRYLQTTSESGREIVARLPSPSLNLSVERPHIFVGRYLGNRQLDPQLDDLAAVVDVVSYSELSAW